MAILSEKQRQRAAIRLEVERLIFRYPDVSTAEIHRLIDYFRNQATRFDLAAIAANRTIRTQYRALCRDHRVDRLRSWQRTITVALAAILALGALFSVTS
jgi:hypothetical protein